MKKAFDSSDREGVLELHEILAGESGVTHEVIVRAPSMAEWLAGKMNLFQQKLQRVCLSTRPYSSFTCCNRFTCPMLTK